jgi:hypothetical protein
MLPKNVYNERISKFCQQCEWWHQHQCRKGHLPTSPTGCPIRKFEPVLGAGYDEDTAPEPVAPMPLCCGQNNDMPDLTWAQVLAIFSKSMTNWAKAGLPMVPSQARENRLQACSTCPHKKNFWCKLCKCVCYLKTAIATEKCPDNPARWR